METVSVPVKRALEVRDASPKRVAAIRDQDAMSLFSSSGPPGLCKPSPAGSEAKQKQQQQQHEAQQTIVDMKLQYEKQIRNVVSQAQGAVAQARDECEDAVAAAEAKVELSESHVERSKVLTEKWMKAAVDTEKQRRDLSSENIIQGVMMKELLTFEQNKVKELTDKLTRSEAAMASQIQAMSAKDSEIEKLKFEGSRIESACVSLQGDVLTLQTKLAQQASNHEAQIQKMGEAGRALESTVKQLREEVQAAIGNEQSSKNEVKRLDQLVKAHAELAVNGGGDSSASAAVLAQANAEIAKWRQDAELYWMKGRELAAQHDLKIQEYAVATEHLARKDMEVAKLKTDMDLLNQHIGARIAEVETKAGAKVLQEVELRVEEYERKAACAEAARENSAAEISALQDIVQQLEGTIQEMYNGGYEIGDNGGACQSTIEAEYEHAWDASWVVGNGGDASAAPRLQAAPTGGDASASWAGAAGMGGGASAHPQQAATAITLTNGTTVYVPHGATPAAPQQQRESGRARRQGRGRQKHCQGSAWD